MSRTKEEIQELVYKYQPDIDRLKKMLLNIHAVASIRFWYWRLGNFVKSPHIHEDLMMMDALTTSIVMSYGRLFGSGNGSTKLSNKIIPPSFKLVHQHIIDLRNTKYAHHDGHESIESNMEIDIQGECINVIPNLEILICFGAPKEWGPLFEWLDTYMHETIKIQLSLLTEKTGIEWNMPNGDAPRWI
ncbi:hypothetical protein [Pedobacter hiemivivus]|uniref:HEPN AbiU2-like domain-containing protein n=1 Tax=Pedobacter hiemivivus TaxID=2530454 RepID=A0A4R0N510_9SPHI|nr:hypothetical protein [Pedobacter hiemivivus]TCC95018.1 hypothetical protein EZ444_16050 [Pedobacter hiemivivus]